MKDLKKWKADPSKGEVFTPIELVNLILDKIPSDVWTNPNSTFLDPCMGTGVFLIEIVRRLVYIYGYSELDAKSRVYGYEIRVKYINRMLRRGFLNVQHKDFLCDEIKMKFDVVIGNPPYQSSTSEENSANALWTKFGLVSKNLLVDGGYLAIIHPDSWMNYCEEYENFNKGRMTTKLYRSRIFNEISPLYINVGDDLRKKYFPNIGVDFSIVIGKKTKKNNQIEFVHNSNSLFLTKLGSKIVPKTGNRTIINIFEKLFNQNKNFFPVLKNTDSNFVSDKRKWRHISINRTDEYKYPLCNTSSQYNKGQFLWSSVPHMYQNISKVIFSDSGYSRPFFDSGTYGLSSHSFGIECIEKDSEKIIFYLNSKTINYLLSFLCSSGAESKISVIKDIIPFIEVDNISVDNEITIIENLSKLYNLEENESKIIRDTVL